MLTVITPAATGNLTVRDTVKADLEITGSTQDALFDRLIAEASSLIAAHCNRTTFGREAVRQTEYLRQSRECIVLLRDLDVTISAVTESGIALTVSDYEIDGSLLYRLDPTGFRSEWTSGTKVVIDYSSGYALLGLLPHALERACLDTIRHLYFSRTRDSQLRSERVLDIIEQSFATPTTATAGDLPLDVQEKLEPWVYRWVA